MAPAAAPATDLVARHLWIVEHFVARYGRFAPHADLRAAGTHGLCEAAAKFEPGRGRAFSTYAWNWVKGYVCSELRRSHVVPVPEHTARGALKAGAPVRGVVVFGVPDVVQDDEQERQSDRSMRLRAVRSAVGRLGSLLERAVVRAVLRGLSIEEVARELFITQTRAQELLDSATRQLGEIFE